MKKGKLILYACSGLGVNMLNIIVGSYLCSALLVGGFDKNVERWTYLNKDLVVAGLWAVLAFIAKIVDGLIDIPFSHFTDNLRTKWGRRKPSLVIGFVPMIIAYLLFLVPLNSEATILNTIWFAVLLCIFYGTYTLTMITYYATFSEIAQNEQEISLLSNAKSVCDVAYFCLGFALLPAFISMGMNIRTVALIFLPLSLTMLIPMFLLKEKPLADAPKLPKAERVTVAKSFGFVLKDKHFLLWLCVLAVMNVGLQLFLSGINEFFSTMKLNMTFIMGSCFVPVPLTIMLYNKIVKKRGLGFGFRYILLVFSIGMALMYLCPFLPEALRFPFAIFCALIVSVSIGAFFSVTYSVPSFCAAQRRKENEASSSMYFAIQGLFEAASAGLGASVILVWLKKMSETTNAMSYMTVIVAFFCMAAFALSFLLPKSFTQLGKEKV